MIFTPKKTRKPSFNRNKRNKKQLQKDKSEKAQETQVHRSSFQGLQLHG